MNHEIRNKFNDIHFEPIPHRYTKAGREFTSVTTCLHEYTQEFDAERFSKKKAEEKGVPQSEILTLWDINREYACVLGTELHFYIETYLLYGRKIETMTGIDERVLAFHEFWDKLSEKIEIIDCEILVYDEISGVAGTIDCLAKNKKTGKYIIIDWKSNKEIKYDNQWQNLKKPFEHLEDCNFNHYSLQLSTYQEIITRAFPEMEFENSRIVHFAKGGTYKILRTNNLSAEAIIMLERKQNE